MKTLMLSSDDIQNFSKLVCDTKSAGTQLPTAAAITSTSIATSNGVNNGSVGIAHGQVGPASNYNLMALQYYLKHSNNKNTPAVVAGGGTTGDLKRALPAVPPTSQQTVVVTQAAQAQQQLLAQSQLQLKQLQLKQPTVHHQQHSSFHHHHHPYYQHSVAATLATTAVPHVAHAQTHAYNYTHTHNHSGGGGGGGGHSLPVYALNQNSNFSAASSSTGGGTASSHAPTQQSNTTGSSLSPPSTSGSARTTSTTGHSTGHSPSGGGTQVLLRGSAVNGGTKKLKTEPVLSQFHQSERLSFANTHIVWGEEHWKRVVFQDERKFNLDGPDGFSYYFHDLRNYERTLSQRPRGNSVYLYVLISAGGPIHLEVSTAKQKPETCIETIVRERGNILKKLGGNADFILQDHNWTANAIPSTQEWLSAEGIKTQKWPTIAHDLNIMENVWGWLIREVYDGGRKFSRKDDLIFRIREAWSRLPIDLLSNLYSTLPERITELYYTRGVYTNC